MTDRVQQLELPIGYRVELKRHKIGDFSFLGTEEDFRTSDAEVLKLNFEERMEKKRALSRRLRALDPLPTLRNRFDRMKSYCTDNGIDWRVSFEDYLRLWNTAPDVWDDQEQSEVRAKDMCNRRQKVRATRVSTDQKYVDRSNLCLKIGDRIIHGPI